MPDPLDEIVALADAAAELGIAPVTLRAQAGRGNLRARNVGKTWITTRAEVERYRREHLGKLGRPRNDAPPRGYTRWSEMKARMGLADETPEQARARMQAYIDKLEAIVAEEGRS